MNNVFTNKRVLITGAAGSFGIALVKHVLKSKCKVIRALSNDENGLYELSSHFNSFDKRKKFESVMEENNIRYLHGDVTDLQRCVNASENIDIVIHAAAIKHVPFCEFNPFEANKINVTGTQNMVLASMQNKVKNFLLISTDKVVNPSSCLGATKLLAEKITVNANNEVSLVGYNISNFDYLGFAENFSVSSQDEAPSSIAFNNDGTKMFVLGIIGDDINEYNLGSPYDVSSANFSGLMKGTSAPKS